MFIAKMHTRYPDFHGKGYYNFLMDTTQDGILEKIEDNSHDFSLEGIVKTRFKSVEALVAKYPTKESLNERYFDVQV